MKKVSYNAPFTLSFCLLSFSILIANQVWFKTDTQSIMQNYFMVYQDQLDQPWFYFRLFSHVLGHKDLSHFINNFLIILLIGPLLEEKYGSGYLFYLSCMNALITGIIFILFFPANQALMGASGILFMMIMMTSFTNKDKNSIPLTLLFVAGLYLGQDIYNMLFKQDNVSQTTHLLGGLMGIYAIYHKPTPQDLSC